VQPSCTKKMLAGQLIARYKIGTKSRDVSCEGSHGSCLLQAKPVGASSLCNQVARDWIRVRLQFVQSDCTLALAGVTTNIGANSQAFVG